MTENITIEAQATAPAGFPLLMDAKTLGAILGFDEFTIYRFARQGKIPSRKIGSRLRFNLQDVLDSTKI